MSRTSLRRLLNLFEESQGALSIPYLAKELGVTTGRVESLVDFWVQKGKIRISTSLSACGSCGVKGDCPLVFDLPKVYELVSSGNPKDRSRSVPCSL